MGIGSAVRAQTGVALLTAMIVLALVTSAAVAMACRQQLDIRRAANLLDSDQAYLQALGVESWAEGVLLRDAERNGIDSRHDSWAQPLPSQEIAGGSVSGVIEDLQGRFNLNDLRTTGPASSGPSAPEQSQTPAKASATANTTPDPPSATAQPARAPGTRPVPTATGGAKLAAQRFRRLLANLGLDPALADAVMDWLDADNDARFPGGAEDDWYLRQHPAYRAANRMMSSPSELLLVRGVTPEIYERLRPFVTALPGYTAINVNTAGPEVLMALADGISRADAQGLVSRRRSAAFASVQDFLQSPALAGRRIDAEGLGVASSFFAVHSAATVAGARVNLSSILSRSQTGGVQVIARMQADPGDG